MAFSGNARVFSGISAHVGLSHGVQRHHGLQSGGAPDFWRLCLPDRRSHRFCRIFDQSYASCRMARGTSPEWTQRPRPRVDKPFGYRTNICPDHHSFAVHVHQIPSAEAPSFRAGPVSPFGDPRPKSGGSASSRSGVALLIILWLLPS